MKDDDWDAIMDTNLKSVYRLSKAVLRGMMKARYGRIIQYRLGGRRQRQCGQANYAAAKAALIGFTKSLAQEVGSRNITVNCVAPGFIDTDMTRALPRRSARRWSNGFRSGRLGAPEDIAHAVAFLASAGRRLHHRRHAARQWRHVYAVCTRARSRPRLRDATAEAGRRPTRDE